MAWYTIQEIYSEYSARWGAFPAFTCCYWEKGAASIASAMRLDLQGNARPCLGRSCFRTGGHTWLENDLRFFFLRKPMNSSRFKKKANVILLSLRVHNFWRRDQKATAFNWNGGAQGVNTVPTVELKFIEHGLTVLRVEASRLNLFHARILNSFFRGGRDLDMPNSLLPIPIVLHLIFFNFWLIL